MISHLRSMLGRLQSFPRTPWVVFFGILFVGIFALTAFPAQAQLESITNGLIIGAAHIMIVVANIAIGLTIFFLRFFIMLASYNNYIDVDVVQLGWIMVRDVANMFFVVALLVIAFGTILGLEEYEWKKNLVKLILAAILINFSNLICQLFIDVAHVFSITFLNAISATAGGNLINMFKLDQITALAGVDEPSGINVELLAAAVPAMLFALMAAAALGSYVYVMAARVVALWALIIFSPLAFIFGVLPKTKSYAEKWWTEFNNNIIVVPIMVFFLWLSFATLGLGNIADQIQTGLPEGVQIDSAQQGKTEYKKTALSLSKVTTWENMASFLIAFAFLMRGIQETEQTGVTGAGAIGSAVDFAKKVGTIASGYAAGRWLASGAKDMAVTGLKGIRKGAYDLTLANRVERTGNWFKKQYAGIQDWRNGGPMQDNYKKGHAENVADDHELSEADKARGWELRKNEDTGKMQKVATKDLTDFRRDEKGQPVFRGFIQKRLYMNQLKLTQSRKELEKVEKSAERRQEIMDKSIEAQPDHIFKSRIFGTREINKDLDRIEMGVLEGMDERSNAKTAQFKAIGRENVLGNKRFKTESAGGGIKESIAALVPIIGGTNLDPRFQNERDTVGEQIVSHKEAAATTDKRIEEIMSRAKNRFYKGEDKRGEGKNVLEGRVQAELEIKAQEAEAKKLQSGATTKIALAEGNNVLARTIAEEKAAHLEEQRLAKGQKAEERAFYETSHGEAELLEETVLKEQIAASEAEIKKEEAEAKSEFAKKATEERRKVKEAEERGETYTPESSVAEFIKAQDQKVAATKQASVRETLASSVEKQAELEYQKVGGQDDLTAEVQAKETIAATEAQLKEVEAKEKATQAADENSPYRQKMAERIEADRKAKLEEQKVTAVEKIETRRFSVKKGKSILEAEAILGSQIAGEDSLVKQLEAEAKNRLIAGELDGATNLDLRGISESFSYEGSLREQNLSQIVQNAVSSLETRSKNRGNGKIMEEAGNAEAEAEGLIDQANNINATGADPLLQELRAAEDEKRSLEFERRQLVTKFNELNKDKIQKTTRIAELEKLISAETDTTKKGQLEDEKNKINDELNGPIYTGKITTAQTALSSFNTDPNKGGKISGLKTTIKNKTQAIATINETGLTNDQRLEKERLKQEAKKKREQNYAWQYAQAKALEEVANVEYQYHHNTLLSDVEQVVVHGKRGIQTPTTAASQPIEHYGKTYKDMNYEMFTESLGSSLKSYVSRRKEAAKIQTQIDDPATNDEEKAKLKAKLQEVAISFDDRMAYAGLLVKGQEQNWIDDAIWKSMQSELGPEVSEKLGWQDQVFDNKKINDLMALFATGADLEFAETNSYVTDMMDAADEEFGMSIPDFLDKLYNQRFTADEQSRLTAKVQANRKSNNILTNNSIISDIFKKKERVDKHKKTTQENQSQIQLITNLRDKAAGSSHPENGGHGKFVATKDGKYMDVLIGQKMADRNVLGEVKKIGVSTRAGMQSHGSYQIDEASGFASGIRQASMSTVRAGIGSENDYRNTNERFELHSLGLSSTESKADYLSNDGFLVTGQKADGSESERHKWARDEFARTKDLYATLRSPKVTGDGKNIDNVELVQRQQTVNDTVNNLFADRMRDNMADFLLTMGKMGNVRGFDALRGQMNLSVLVHGKTKHITNINELVQLYNAGAFSWQGEQPPDKIPAYSAAKDKDKEPPKTTT